MQREFFSTMSALILLLYAIHSLAGIAYEVVWIKLLTASIGMTVTAFGVVLATFMAGLGLGSYVIARWKGASEDHNGIRSTYHLVAVLQTLMGLLGIAFPLFLIWGDHLYMLVAPETEGLEHLLIRGLYVGFLLLPVTTLHGMNFPVLASLLTRCLTRSGTTKPGLLYSVGLLASGLGSLSSLALIPTLGLQGTSLALGTTNLILAAAAFLAGNRTHAHAQSVKEETSPPRKRGTPDSAVPTALSLSALQTLGAVVGFLVISLEIIGAQYVWLIVNVTAYAEGILLTTVLLMMGLGSGLYLVLRERVRDRSVPFMWGLFIALIAQLTVLPMAGDIASLFDRAFQELRPHELTTVQILFGDALLAMTILGVPMFRIGHGILQSLRSCDLTATRSAAEGRYFSTGTAVRVA